MDPVNPWLDADSVRRMADQLLGPARELPEDAEADSGFGPEFEGFSSTGDEPAEVESTEDGKTDEPYPEPETGDGAGDRLVGFRERMEDRCAAFGVFVLDGEGRPLLEDPLWAQLYFLARSIALSDRPAPGRVGKVHVKVAADTYLDVIPLESPRGSLVIGLVVPEPIASDAAQAVAEELLSLLE